MHEEKTFDEIRNEWHGTYSAYAIGLVASLILTGASFYLVWSRLLNGVPLILTIVALGLAQAVAQLLFFLHLGKEHRPKWELMIFLFMVMVLLILVLGSLWIMYDLNHRVMPNMH